MKQKIDTRDFCSKKDLLNTVFWAIEKIERHEKHRAAVDAVDLPKSTIWQKFKAQVSKLLGNEKYVHKWQEKVEKHTNPQENERAIK